MCGPQAAPPTRSPSCSHSARISASLFSVTLPPYSMLFSTSFLFFFSSRRRHTRSLCDWSSDVCSSDLKRHMVSNRSQRYLPHVPRNNSRCCRNVGDSLGRQHLPRRRDRGDTCCDVDCRTEEVDRSAQDGTVVKAGPCQRNPWLGSAGRKQASEHLKGGCRVRKSKHRFVTDPLDRRRKPSEGLAHQLLEATKHRYCRRISIDIRYRTEARQIDERDGRDRGLETVDSADVRTHS